MYSFQLTKNIIGIDLGTHSLKIALGQRAGEKVTLVNYDIRRLPEPAGSNQTLSPKEISAFIQQTLKELGIKAADTVSEVTGPRTVARHLFMPDLADDEMREAIRWRPKTDFPFSLEEAIIDFYKLDVVKREEGEQEAEIISAVATREVVEEQIALLRDAGLKPLFLSIPSFDLMQAYRITQPSPWSETAAVIDLGHKSTQIIVLKDGKLKFSREIAGGGEAFTQALTGLYEVDGRSVEITESVAEKIKWKAGLLEVGEAGRTEEGIPLDQVHKRLEAVKDRLILEVERSLGYYKNQFKDHEIDRILLTGGGSLLKGLPEAMENNLEISVYPFSSAGRLSLKKKINKDLFLRELPFLTTLLGLITQTRPFINLSSTYLTSPVKEVSYRKYLKPALVSALLMGIVIGFGLPYWTASRQVAQLRKEMTVKKEQVERVGKPAEELARLEKEEASLNKEMEGLPQIDIKRLPMRDLFQELTRLIPANITLTRFQFFKAQETSMITGLRPAPHKSEPATGKLGETQVGGSREEGKWDYQLVIQGIAFGSDQEIISNLSDFTQNLNRSNYFKEAKVQATLKVTEYLKGAAEFKVLAKLGEGPSTVPRVSS